MKVKWIVSWRFNGKEFNEGFEFYHEALAKQMQLGAFKQEATIHQVY